MVAWGMWAYKKFLIFLVLKKKMKENKCPCLIFTFFVRNKNTPWFILDTWCTKCVQQ